MKQGYLRKPTDDFVQRNNKLQVHVKKCLGLLRITLIIETKRKYSSCWFGKTKSGHQAFTTRVACRVYLLQPLPNVSFLPAFSTLRLP